MRMILLAMMVPLAACSASAQGSTDGAGSGGTSRTFAERDFTGVELHGSDDVDIKIASAFTIRAEGPAKVLDQLKIERVGDTLRIARKDDDNWSWGNSKSARIYVTMPRIAKARVSGSGDMTIGRAEGASFAASTEGSGNIRIAALNAPSVDLSVAGSGDIEATGQADRLAINIAGSGEVQARGLKAKSANVSIAGSGAAVAEVNGPANVSIMGSGDVDLGAGATCTTNKMGSGDVRCGK
ncbi:head GIN domain-containing protein [Sphingomonas aquatica]|uniref:head GIN domain-containing protein n=1 Tax=Sphingomonas aquatica TaxID=1763824 RepID=UPI00301E2C4B